MTTSLSSDIPVGYFSWAKYDIMAPLEPKTEKALAAAFTLNCGARNFRLQALEALEKSNIKIDSYVDKVKTLKHYMLSLAFENSNEEDYVTEKIFQSLVAGTIPVVVGAPNIQEFAPSPGSILHIKELKDAEAVSRIMKHLAENPTAFNHEEAIGKILARGHSCVPVYSRNPKNIIRLLLVKSLLTVRAEIETPVSAVSIKRMLRLS